MLPSNKDVKATPVAAAILADKKVDVTKSNSYRLQRKNYQARCSGCTFKSRQGGW